MSAKKKIMQLFDRAIALSMQDDGWERDFEISAIRRMISGIASGIVAVDSDSLIREEDAIAELFFAEPASRENIGMMLEMHREAMFKRAYQ